MKSKIIVGILMAAGLATSSYGQGILAQNVNNTGGLNASSNGRIFVDGVLFDGLTANVGVTISGGPDANSLAPVGLGTYKANTDPKGYTGVDAGLFQLGSGVLTVPGLAAGANTATIKLEMWYDGTTLAGLYANYAAAQAGGKVGTATFTVAVSNPLAQPPTTPGDFGSMPSINLVSIPEPSVIALAGLGAAALLVLRRRN